MTTWTPRPPAPDEPACWSWPIPPRRSREDEIAHQLAESERGHPDDRLTWDVVAALVDVCDPRVEEFHAGRCALCGGTGGANVDDHCHATGQRRGWLHRSCNQREGTSGHILFVRYRLWHPAAILGVHEMYSGRGWRRGWLGGPPRGEGERPATPWPAWDDAWARPNYDPPPDTSDVGWGDDNLGMIARRHTPRQHQPEGDPVTTPTNTSRSAPMTPPTIASTKPCWVLSDSRGMWDERHFDTREQGEADLARADDPDHGREADLVERPASCLLAVANCGYTYDEEGEGVEHFATEADLASSVIDAGWTDGGTRGWLCSPDSSCECPR